MVAKRKGIREKEPAVLSVVESEHQTYLRVAEAVLSAALAPLKAREIVDRGIERGLFGDHPLSRTPEKSMQARLSMDILDKRKRSKFVRTERGRFTLWSKLQQASATVESAERLLPMARPLEQYIAERRVLRTPSERVLCTPESRFRNVLTFQGIETDATPIIWPLLHNRDFVYVPRAEAEARDDAKQFVTYVMVQCGHQLLCFRRSYLSRAAEFLRGSKCIAFGGHVSAADADMLSRDDQGLSACARRELMEELSLEPLRDDILRSQALPSAVNPSTVKLFQNAPLELLGVLNDDSSEVGRRHVAIVYRIWLDDWDTAKHLQKGDSSLKGLNWLDISRVRLELSEYEYWSQLCLRKFYPSNVISRSGFKILRGTAVNQRAIVVAGRIGSGKTETARYLAQKLDLPMVNTGKVVQELMGIPPISEVGREEFQVKAFKFIRSEHGSKKLAERIVEEARGAERFIIDGVRQLATYEELLRLLDGNVGLIFVQTPPDVSYEMYRFREARNELTFTYREFLKIYDAPVEEEIPSLGREAELYIYNAFGIEAFRRTLDEVAEALGAEVSDTLKRTKKARAVAGGGVP